MTCPRHLFTSKCVYIHCLGVEGPDWVVVSFARWLEHKKVIPFYDGFHVCICCDDTSYLSPVYLVAGCFFFFTHIYFPSSGQQAVVTVTGVFPSSPRFLPPIFIAHRVQQSHCSSIFHRVLPTHALALSAKVNLCTPKKSPRVCTRGDSNSRNWPIYQARG